MTTASELTTLQKAKAWAITLVVGCEHHRRRVLRVRRRQGVVSGTSDHGGKSSIVCHQGFWTVFLAEGVWLTAKQLGPQKWLVDDWDHLRTVQVQGRCVYIERPALLSERLPLTCAAKLSAPMKAT